MEADSLLYHSNLPKISTHSLHLSSNGDLNLNTSLDVDDDLLDNLSWGVETIFPSALHYRVSFFPQQISNLLNQTLVDSHLEAIPCLGTFTARSLTGGNLKGLGWQTDGTLDAKILGLGTLDELLADLLEGLDFSAGQGDTDLVSLLYATTNISNCDF